MRNSKSGAIHFLSSMPSAKINILVFLFFFFLGWTAHSLESLIFEKLFGYFQYISSNDCSIVFEWLKYEEKQYKFNLP